MFDDPAPPIRNLSVSKIEKALLCPKQFKYQYLDRIPQLSSGKFLAGNVVHEVLEYALQEFAKTEKYPSAKTLDDMFDPTWEAKAKEEEEKETFLGWEWPKDDPEERMKRDYRPLVTLARKEVLPTLKPWMIGTEPVVEHRIQLELQSEVGPFPLLGYIDLLEDNGVLADWKTTDNKVSDRAKSTWLQFAAYSLWAYPIVGQEEVDCEKIFLVRKEKPFVERVPFKVGERHRQYFVEVAAQVWKMVQRNSGFLPATGGWWCQPGWCAFYAGCQGSVAKQKP